ncbi:MAG: hypothetical protein DRZ76_01735 [Candidatus Nealsonbacteria bacterium]|nr:MAG: hypothetical protein DRZ76_01735 [Candidatus Nealsonbacteria bacterium]
MVGHYLNTLILQEGFRFFSGQHGLVLTKHQEGNEKGYRSPTLKKFQFSTYTGGNEEEIYIDFQTPPLAKNRSSEAIAAVQRLNAVYAKDNKKLRRRLEDLIRKDRQALMACLCALEGRISLD